MPQYENEMALSPCKIYLREEDIIIINCFSFMKHDHNHGHKKTNHLRKPRWATRRSEKGSNKGDFQVALNPLLPLPLVPFRKHTSFSPLLFVEKTPPFTLVYALKFFNPSYHFLVAFYRQSNGVSTWDACPFIWSGLSGDWRFREHWGDWLRQQAKEVTCSQPGALASWSRRGRQARDVHGKLAPCCRHDLRRFDGCWSTKRLV